MDFYCYYRKISFFFGSGKKNGKSLLNLNECFLHLVDLLKMQNKREAKSAENSIEKEKLLNRHFSLFVFPDDVINQITITIRKFIENVRNVVHLYSPLHKHSLYSSLVSCYNLGDVTISFYGYSSKRVQDFLTFRIFSFSFSA